MVCTHVIASHLLYLLHEVHNHIKQTQILAARCNVWEMAGGMCSMLAVARTWSLGKNYLTDDLQAIYRHMSGNLFAVTPVREANKLVITELEVLLSKISPCITKYGTCRQKQQQNCAYL